jgi:murein DD-endopeptidase MepM/ murein hydrolase activator NlpD
MLRKLTTALLIIFTSVTFAAQTAEPATSPIVTVGGNTQTANNQSSTPTFIFPSTCTLNENCYIKFYVDHGTNGAIADFKQGQLSSHQHTGTDIALATFKQADDGVDVIAAADGKVLRTRDGMRDRALRTNPRKHVNAKYACGNGVFIEHENDWTTQYCHMQNGSITVKPGDTVKAGQVIGKIGYSGLTLFPHLHFAVRQGEVIHDPFAENLWATPIEYKGYGIIDMGISDHSFELKDALFSPPRRTELRITEPALIAWVRSYGLQKGDKDRIIFVTPEKKTYQNPIESPVMNFQLDRFTYGGYPLINHITSVDVGQWEAVYQVKRGDAPWETLRVVPFKIIAY